MAFTADGVEDAGVWTVDVKRCALRWFCPTQILDNEEFLVLRPSTRTTADNDRSHRSFMLLFIAYGHVASPTFFRLTSFIKRSDVILYVALVHMAGTIS
jgi:hypothetical protein